MSERTCSVDGCSRAAKHGPMCHGHRRRVRVHGDPMAHVPLDVRTPSGGPCTYPECDRVATSRDLCPAHYQQTRKRLRASAKPVPKQRNYILVAMELYVRPRASECWTDWVGASTKGRPVVTLPKTRRNVPLARYVRFLEDGEWPVYACHHCDNPACWNPDHIYAGDPTSNVADMLSRGRHRFILPRASNMHLGKVDTAS